MPGARLAVPGAGAAPWIPAGCSGVLEAVHECVSVPQTFYSPGRFSWPRALLLPWRTESIAQRRPAGLRGLGQDRFSGILLPKFQLFPPVALPWQWFGL